MKNKVAEKAKEGSQAPSRGKLHFPLEDKTSRIPLHARVREFLRELILGQYQDGEKFYTEPALISELGVSQGTVRRALTDLAHEGLLVRKVPSGTFVQKKSAEAQEIRVVMPGCDSVFLMAILERLLNDCQSQNIRVRIHHTLQGAHASETMRQFQGSPSHLRVLLLGVPRHLAHPLYLMFSKHGIRVVNIDTLSPQCGDAYVGVDNADGIRQGMDHLLALGHRRILLLVNEPMTEGTIQARVREFRAIVRAKHLTGSRVEIFPRNSYPSEKAKARLRELLSTDSAPTAIFNVSDSGAWVTLKHLAALRVAVPSRVSVLGFDDDRASAYMQPPLSTLAQPIDTIARHAIALLVQRDHPQGTELLAPALVVRESTGPVSG